MFYLENVINVHGVEYHRNGSGGTGFHVVTFNECGNSVKLLGIVFESDEHADTEGSIAVINPARPTERFRYEYYARSLRAAVAQYEGGL